MNVKSLLSFRKSGHSDDSAAGIIVFLMLALVFVPILGAHAAVQWNDQLSHGTHQLASMASLIVSLF